MTAPVAPFSANLHCSRAIQLKCGLNAPNVNMPWVGDRTAEGVQGYDIVCSQAHMEAIETPEALAIYGVVPNTAKNTAGNTPLTRGIAKLATNAAEPPPMGGNGPPMATTFYVSLGSPIFTDLDATKMFIAFYYNNTDAGDREVV